MIGNSIIFHFSYYVNTNLIKYFKYLKGFYLALQIFELSSKESEMPTRERGEERWHNAKSIFIFSHFKITFSSDLLSVFFFLLLKKEARTKKNRSWSMFGCLEESESQVTLDHSHKLCSNIVKKNIV